MPSARPAAAPAARPATGADRFVRSIAAALSRHSLRAHDQPGRQEAEQEDQQQQDRQS